MIISLPCVDNDGREFGSEICFKFAQISAIKRMDKWHVIRNDDGRDETKIVIDGCCTIFIGREEFDVKANYEELKAKFIEHNEMFA